MPADFSYQLQLHFLWNNWNSVCRLRQDEPVSHPLRFIEAHLQVVGDVGIEFAHRHGLVSHPKLQDVILCPPEPEPRVSEAAEAVPSHTFLFEVQRRQSWREPSV